MNMGKAKRPTEPEVVTSMADLRTMISRKVHEQDSSLVPDVVLAYATCAPNFIFRVSGFPEAGFKNKEQSNEVPHLYPSNFDPNLETDTMTASDVLRTSREVEVWRNMTKFVTEDVVRNVQNADGHKYTYRNRDKFSLKEGVRLNYVCVDSLQNKNRITATGTRRTKVVNEDGSVSYKKLRAEKVGHGALSVCDCKGFVNVDFDDSKNEIRIVYRHLLIHKGRPLALKEPQVTAPTAKMLPVQDEAVLVGAARSFSEYIQESHVGQATLDSKYQFINGLKPETTKTTGEVLPMHGPVWKPKPANDGSVNPRVYVCNICNKSLSRQEHLKRHVKSVHSQDKPFECPHCGKKFSRHDNMSQHMALRSTICAKRGEKQSEAG